MAEIYLFSHHKPADRPPTDQRRIRQECRCGDQNVTPKYASLTQKLFWVEWRPLRSSICRRGLSSPLFPPEGSIAMPPLLRGLQTLTEGPEGAPRQVPSPSRLPCGGLTLLSPSCHFSINLFFVEVATHIPSKPPPWVRFHRGFSQGYSWLSVFLSWSIFLGKSCSQKPRMGEKSCLPRRWNSGKLGGREPESH